MKSLNIFLSSVVLSLTAIDCCFLVLLSNTGGADDGLLGFLIVALIIPILLIIVVTVITVILNLIYIKKGVE